MRGPASFARHETRQRELHRHPAQAGGRARQQRQDLRGRHGRARRGEHADLARGEAVVVVPRERAQHRRPRGVRVGAVQVEAPQARVDAGPHERADRRVRGAHHHGHVRHVLAHEPGRAHGVGGVALHQHDDVGGAVVVGAHPGGRVAQQPP
nr:hypothetical protein [Cellulomonas flavigena]